MRIFKGIALLINLVVIVLFFMGYTGIKKVYKNHVKTLDEDDVLTEQEEGYYRKYTKYLMWGCILSVIFFCLRIAILFME